MIQPHRITRVDITPDGNDSARLTVEMNSKNQRLMVAAKEHHMQANVFLDLGNRSDRESAKTIRDAIHAAINGAELEERFAALPEAQYRELPSGTD